MLLWVEKSIYQNTNLILAFTAHFVRDDGTLGWFVLQCQPIKDVIHKDANFLGSLIEEVLEQMEISREKIFCHNRSCWKYPKCFCGYQFLFILLIMLRFSGLNLHVWGCYLHKLKLAIDCGNNVLNKNTLEKIKVKF